MTRILKSRLRSVENVLNADPLCTFVCARLDETYGEAVARYQRDGVRLAPLIVMGHVEMTGRQWMVAFGLEAPEIDEEKRILSARLRSDQELRAIDR